MMDMYLSKPESSLTYKPPSVSEISYIKYKFPLIVLKNI